MRVWRKKTVRWVVGGRAVRAGTPGAERKVIESKRFYGTLRLADGRAKQVPLSEDRKAATKLLYRLQADSDSDRALGVTPKARERRRPVGELLSDYGAHLRSKRATERYVTLRLSRLRAVLTATGAGTAADLDAGRIARVLASWRDEGPEPTRRGHGRTPIGVETSNHYVRACRGFSRWLWADGRVAEDTLRSLRTLNSRDDRRRVRRPLTAEELVRLLDATRRSGKTIRGGTWSLPPDDRAWLYTLAAYAGLRASELASLTRASFDLRATTVTVRAAYSKRRRDDVLPLHISLVGPLGTWLRAKPDGRIWEGTWSGASVLRQDLRRAGIPYRDEAGRYADFHALRHTFVSSLARSGVHPSIAKELARHSTITLTMDAYTHAATEELRRSLDTLPPIA